MLTVMIYINLLLCATFSPVTPTEESSNDYTIHVEDRINIRDYTVLYSQVCHYTKELKQTIIDILRYPDIREKFLHDLSYYVTYEVEYLYKAICKNYTERISSLKLERFRPENILSQSQINYSKLIPKFTEELRDIQKNHEKRKRFVQLVFFSVDNHFIIIKILDDLKNKIPSPNNAYEFFKHENELIDPPFFAKILIYDNIILKLNDNCNDKKQGNMQNELDEASSAVAAYQENLRQNMEMILGTEPRRVFVTEEDVNAERNFDDFIITNRQTNEAVPLKYKRCIGCYLIRYIIWRLYLKGTSN